MKTWDAYSIRRLFRRGLLLVLMALLKAEVVFSQGCAPTRFAGAILGTEGDIYLRRGTWQAGLAYRRLTSNRLIQGHVDAGPSSVVESQAIHASLTYGVSDRVAVALNVPFSRGSHETAYPDGQRHQNTASGLGDVSISVSYWLLNANALRAGGNFGVGLGVKLPTGKHDVQGTWWKADGSTIPWPVHQSIEPGDGGWGLMARFQGFQPVFSRTYAYVGASYTLNPKRTTEVVRTPGSIQHWAVPDTWDASVGVAVAVWPEQGFIARLGTIFDGTRKQDLLGAKDDSTVHRLPATAGYLSPGISLTRGVHTLTLGFPVRIYKDFKPSRADDAAGKKGGGGLAKYILQAAYSVRF